MAGSTESSNSPGPYEKALSTTGRTSESHPGTRTAIEEAHLKNKNAIGSAGNTS